jgi:hypothetical protein
MAISPLPQRMIDDITARQFGEKTQKDYIRCVKNLAAFSGRLKAFGSPSWAGPVRRASVNPSTRLR